MQEAVKPDNEERKDGNETRELNHLVWMVNADNELTSVNFEEDRHIAIEKQQHSTFEYDCNVITIT